MPQSALQKHSAVLPLLPFTMAQPPAGALGKCSYFCAYLLIVPSPTTSARKMLTKGPFPANTRRCNSFLQRCLKPTLSSSQCTEN